MKLSVIVPVYNEEQAIAQILDKVLRAPLPESCTREIIVVNDGSTDQTAKLVEPFVDRGEAVLLHQDNTGKTAAVLNGIAHATGEILIIQDGDLEYDPNQYQKLLEPMIQEGCQVVYGSRFMGSIENMAPKIRLANFMTNWTLNVIFGTKITDNNTCYKVFKRDALKDITITSKQYGFDCEVTVKLLKKGIPIKEVPIDYVGRSREEGKKIGFLTGFASYLQIFRYSFKK